MLDTKLFIDSLVNRLGFRGFTGVPCSNLRYLINYTSNQGMYTMSANEGDATAYAAGRIMSGDKMAVFMQNSGLGNAISPITSLNGIYHIPTLYLIGYRGGFGKDEPQHAIMGKITEQLLTLCGIEYFITKDCNDVNQILDRIEDAMTRGVSFALLVDKTDFSQVDYVSPTANSDVEKFQLSRSTVLQEVVKIKDKYPDAIFVTTTGFTSREMYDKYDCENNFYMVGSMGCALAVGCGLAQSNPDKKVVVIDGDGAIMMRPSTLTIASELQLPNLLHVVIDNRTYESTGGQITPTEHGFDLLGVLESAYQSFGEVVNLTAHNQESMEGLVENWCDYPLDVPFIYALATGQADNDLGRPKETSIELVERFEKFLTK